MAFPGNKTKKTLVHLFQYIFLMQDVWLDYDSLMYVTLLSMPYIIPATSR